MGRAAGILIQRTDTRSFLLVRRSAEVLDPGVLGIPGGMIEPGEGAEAAALREAAEELGSIPDVHLIGRDLYRSGDFSYVTFLAEMDGEDAAQWTPTLNWENDAWAWVAPDEVHETPKIHPNVRRILEKWSD